MNDKQQPDGLAAWLTAEIADAISDIRNTWENIAYGKDVHSGGKHGKMAAYYGQAQDVSTHDAVTPQPTPQAERLRWGDIPDHTRSDAQTRDKGMER
jgi:hypothetical protein